jgi:hypothetical protein
MREANKINVNYLQEEAKKSEDKEAFTVLAKMPSYRVGVGARLESPANPIFFVEIIISLCAGHHMNLRFLERKLLILRQLKERGYLLTCEEDGTVSCELAVPSENLTVEYEAAILIIQCARNSVREANHE